MKTTDHLGQARGRGHRHRHRHLARPGQGRRTGPRSPPGAPASTRSPAFPSIISRPPSPARSIFSRRATGRQRLTFQLADLAAEEAVAQAGSPPAIRRPALPRLAARRDRLARQASRCTRPAAEGEGYDRLLDAARRWRTTSYFEASQFGTIAERSPANTARAACRSRCRRPAPPARPRSSSASRRSAAASATARWPSAPTVRPPPRR
jgi:hypothetical protein